MDKYTVDFSQVDAILNAPKMYKLAQVKDKIAHIGCGVVRFRDGSSPALWKIVADENSGEEYIVAMYGDDEPTEVVKSSWYVESDKLKKTATVFYKGTPIKKLVFAELGIPVEELDSFLSYLPERLATNQDIVNKMVNSLDLEYRDRILKLYPEIISSAADK